MRKVLAILAAVAFSIAAFGQNPVNGAMSNPIPNEGVTGTTLNKLVKLTGSPSTAILTGLGDTEGTVGVCAGNCGTTGNAYVATWGLQSCVFDGATSSGDYVQISATTTGDCHDTGATYPTSGQVIGRVLSTNAAGGTYLIDLFGSGIKAVTGGGGGTIPPTTSILKGDGAGNALAAVAGDFPVLNQSTTGNANTASSLNAVPSQCGANNYSTGIAANGNANCVPIASTNLSDSAHVIKDNAAGTFGAFLYDYSSASFKPAKTTVAGLGTASAKSGYAYLVTDGTSASDCSVGGGTTAVNCWSNGTSWVSVGGGAAGIGTVTHTAGALTLNCVVVGNGSADLKCSANTTDDGSTFSTTNANGFSAPKLSASGTNGGLNFLEGTGANLPAALNNDTLRGDSTTHQLIKNPNNSGDKVVVGTPTTAATPGHLLVYAANGYDSADGGVVPSPGNPTITVANTGVTGTTVSTLTKLTGAPSTAVIAATTDTGGMVGVTTGGAGTTGSATIQFAGSVSCVFDGATTAGDYVQISSTTAGNCHDAGATYPTSNQVVGRVLSTNVAGGTYTMDLYPAEIKAAGGGGAGTQTMYVNFAQSSSTLVAATTYQLVESPSAGWLSGTLSGSPANYLKHSYIVPPGCTKITNIVLKAANTTSSTLADNYTLVFYDGVAATGGTSTTITSTMNINPVGTNSGITIFSYSASPLPITVAGGDSFTLTLTTPATFGGTAPSPIMWGWVSCQ